VVSVGTVVPDMALVSAAVPVAAVSVEVASVAEPLSFLEQPAAARLVAASNAPVASRTLREDVKCISGFPRSQKLGDHDIRCGSSPSSPATTQYAAGSENVIQDQYYKEFIAF
jgi:hypothetical protein